MAAEKNTGEMIRQTILNCMFQLGKPRLQDPDPISEEHYSLHDERITVIESPDPAIVDIPEYVSAAKVSTKPANGLAGAAEDKSRKGVPVSPINAQKDVNEGERSKGS